MFIVKRNNKPVAPNGATCSSIIYMSLRWSFLLLVLLFYKHYAPIGAKMLYSKISRNASILVLNCAESESE